MPLLALSSFPNALQDESLNFLFRIIDASISKRTRRGYLSSLRDFSTFSFQKGYTQTPNLILPFSPNQVLHFIAHLANPSRNPRPLKASSIATVVSALSWAETWHGYNILNSRVRKLIKASLRGIRRISPQSPARKLPITPDILRKCVPFITSHPSSLTIWSAMLSSFFGLLRCGEFTSHSSSVPTTTRRQDLVFSADHVSLFLRQSKTDQFGAGCTIYLPRFSGDALCPYSALSRMIRATPHATNLFEINNLPMTRFDFITAVRTLLTASGTPDPSCYAGHSFRRGGATAASDAGLPDYAIKKLGRWNSNCFQLYIHTSRHLLLSFTHHLLRPTSLGGARPVLVSTQNRHRTGNVSSHPTHDESARAHGSRNGKHVHDIHTYISS
jgi:hypothetical protein